MGLFPAWQVPMLISTLVWLVIYFLQFGRMYFCKDNKFGWYPDYVNKHDGMTYSSLTNMLLKDIIKACDGHALNLLAACYLPGVLAAYLQLIRGSKYSKFPRWLSKWMQMRKQLGLMMLFSASLHGIYYCLLFNHSVSDSPWNVKAYLSAGVVGYALAVVLGITSLPSVSSSLSWR